MLVKVINYFEDGYKGGKGFGRSGQIQGTQTSVSS